MRPSGTMHATRPIPWLATILGSCFLIVGGMLALAGGAPGSPAVATLQLVDAAAVLWAGSFIAAARPAHRVGTLLLLGGLITTLLLLLTWYADAALLGNAPLPFGIWAVVGQQVLWPAAYLLLFVLVPLVFPDGRFLSSRWRWLGIGMTGLAVVAMVVAPLDADAGPSPIAVDNPIGILDESIVAPASIGWALMFGLGLLATVASLVIRYRESYVEARRQMRWVAAAIGLTVVVLAAQQISTAIAPAVALPEWSFLVPLAAVPISIAFAIVRHRLFDIDLAIRRSVVFGGLWLAILLIYGGLAGLTGLAAGQLSVGAAVLATIAATVLFQPVRSRFERFADRIAFGERASAYEVVRDFGASMERTLEVNEIGPRLADAARGGMVASWARVVAGDRSTANEIVLGVSGDVFGAAALTVPLIHDDEVVGAIECGPRSEGEYRSRDQEVLATLGRQAALAIRNAGLAADLARRVDVMDVQAAELAASRRRIIDAQEVERRRIERDIHDGVQQQLVSLVAGVRLARNRLPADPERAAVLLQDVQVQALRTIRELRELVRGIHPPVLEDAGLVPAIEAVAGRLPLDVTLDVLEPRSSRYPARIESAAYFVICEALTNVMKHAAVDRASVRIGRSGLWLHVAVCDEGRGFDAAVDAHAAGSGLAGLRDRVAAVGGELMVGSAAGAGTTISARLPIDPT